MDYKDAAWPISRRVEDLLERMTVEEKIGQLIQPFGWKAYIRNDVGAIKLTEEFKSHIAEGGIGSLYGTLRADPWTGVTLANGLSPREGAEAVNTIQRYVMEHTRLGIPILFGEECSHGHMAIGATVFPVPLTIGSTWNTELYRSISRAVAAETRAQGGAATYSPVLDVVRDPRWGRTEETFGEDPHLVAEFAVAAVQGLQGERLDSHTSLLATLKHFAGYGASEGGRNGAHVHMGLRELHEVDLLPFRKAVEAGALSVMTAYNEIDGVPCTSSRYLLQDVLCEVWGFGGFVITDCGAIHMLACGHNTAGSGVEAAAQSLKSGVDMEMSGAMFRAHLHQALEQGLISEDDLNMAAGRVLELKFRLGLFDRPYVDPAWAEQVIGCKEHIALAYQAAAEGIVLLKNEGDLLPLNSSSGTIAVIGQRPCAVPPAWRLYLPPAAGADRNGAGRHPPTAGRQPRSVCPGLPHSRRFKGRVPSCAGVRRASRCHRDGAWRLQRTGFRGGHHRFENRCLGCDRACRERYGMRGRH